MAEPGAGSGPAAAGSAAADGAGATPAAAGYGGGTDGGGGSGAAGSKGYNNRDVDGGMSAKYVESLSDAWAGGVTEEEARVRRNATDRKSRFAVQFALRARALGDEARSPAEESVAGRQMMQYAAWVVGPAVLTMAALHWGRIMPFTTWRRRIGGMFLGTVVGFLSRPKDAMDQLVLQSLPLRGGVAKAACPPLVREFRTCIEHAPNDEEGRKCAAYMKDNMRDWVVAYHQCQGIRSCWQEEGDRWAKFMDNAEPIMRQGAPSEVRTAQVREFLSSYMAERERFNTPNKSEGEENEGGSSSS